MSCSCSTWPTRSPSHVRVPTPTGSKREGDDFHAAVRRAYRDLAPRYGWVVVDGNGTVDEVAGRVGDAVGPVLAG